MTPPARSVTITPRRAPRRRAAKPEAIVVGIPELTIDDAVREAVIEALADLLLHLGTVDQDRERLPF